MQDLNTQADPLAATEQQTSPAPRGPASKPPAVSTLDILLSPGSTFGRYLAQSGMSGESARLANDMGEIKDRANGKTLGDCLQEKIIQAAYDGKATLCTPDKKAMVSELAESTASHAVGLYKGTAGRVLGQVFDSVASGIQVQNNHKDAIRILAQNNYPGVAYSETVIESNKVTVWADAIGAGLYPDDPKMKIYTQVDSLNGAPEEAQQFRQNAYKKIDQIATKTANNALESAQNYIGENGYERFRAHIEEAGLVMEQQYLKEQKAAQEFRQSIQPTPQDRLNVAMP